MPKDTRTLQSEIDDMSNGAFNSPTTDWHVHCFSRGICHPFAMLSKVLQLAPEPCALRSSAGHFQSSYKLIDIALFEALFLFVNPSCAFFPRPCFFPLAERI